MHSSVMISHAKRTPDSANKYLETKIKWLDRGIIQSIPAAQIRICQFRSHAKGTCEYCTPKARDKNEKDSLDEMIISDSE